MATLDWQHTRTNGVTFVEVQITSETESHIELESNLTPVWPPRRQGVPEAGWDGETFEGTVTAAEPLVVGYATPAEPTDPPVELETGPPKADDAVSPRTLVRALGEAKPPRDAIPDMTATQGEPTGTSQTAQVNERHTSDSTSPPAALKDEPAAAEECLTDEQTAVDIELWLEAVESRIREAEQLTAVKDPDQAREAVAAVGGIDEIKQLQAQLAADRERLERLTERQQTLTQRLDAVDIRVSALERLT